MTNRGVGWVNSLEVFTFHLPLLIKHQTSFKGSLAIWLIKIMSRKSLGNERFRCVCFNWKGCCTECILYMLIMGLLAKAHHLEGLQDNFCPAMAGALGLDVANASWNLCSGRKLTGWPWWSCNWLAAESKQGYRIRRKSEAYINNS